MNDKLEVCADLIMRKEYGLCLRLCISLDTIHTLVIGQSGSGKSIFLKFLLNQLVHSKKAEIYLFDFKNSGDFRFLEGYKNYYRGDGCIEGLENFYDIFQQARNNPEMYAGYHNIIIFDELPAYLIYLAGKDKKLAEYHKAMISEVLMLGRSLGFGFICAMQRPDAQFLANGARDNFFNIVALGNLSSEAKQMVFSGYELPEYNYQTGQGLLLRSGKEIEQIIVPYFSTQKLELMERVIKERLKF